MFREISEISEAGEAPELRLEKQTRSSDPLRQAALENARLLQQALGDPKKVRADSINRYADQLK